MAYRNRRTIRSHLFLVMVGILAYTILFYAPHRLAHELLKNAGGGLSTWLLFGIGALSMMGMCYLEEGYNNGWYAVRSWVLSCAFIAVVVKA